jgi:hypothetical protein
LKSKEGTRKERGCIVTLLQFIANAKNIANSVQISSKTIKGIQLGYEQWTQQMKD